MVLIGPQYLVISVTLSPHAHAVEKTSVERLRMRHYQCILISSTMVFLLPIQIGILSLLCRRGFLAYLVDNYDSLWVTLWAALLTDLQAAPLRMTLLVVNAMVP